MALHKVAVVVGAGPGLGGACALRFAKEGFKVALLARSLNKSQPLQQQIEQQGGKAISIACDAGDAQSVEAAFSKVRDQLGHPEVLIYNAGPSFGGWPPPGILDLKAAEFSTALAVGATGGLLCAQQVLPQMVQAGAGTILFTGATASLRGGARFAQLAAPKFALRGLSQCIAREFFPQGIHVAHVIIDGVIATSSEKVPDRPLHTFLSPDAIADTYWMLHKQDKTAWTHELELRPYVEKW